jgi:hypothetical protein
MSFFILNLNDEILHTSALKSNTDTAIFLFFLGSYVRKKFFNTALLRHVK